ncbi:MAG: hypothetical protein DMF39_07770 [Verrucomicrobia bacterium]|nr:MAG: hypothetical protein DMF39_07770 [Verrucomicrobiota bacterium]
MHDPRATPVAVRETPTSNAIAPTLSVGLRPSKMGVSCQRSDQLRFHLRIGEKKMTTAEYEKVQTLDRERFVECPKCGEVLSLEELLLHLAYKHCGSEKRPMRV